MSTEQVRPWSAEAGEADRPLVALIHGSMDRATGMLRVSRFLDHQLRVLRYDRRGYSRSVHMPPAPGMAVQVDDLLGLLGGRRAVLIGHSFGGNVALAAAARCPQQIAAVGVYEPPQTWEPWWPGSTAGATAMGLADDPDRAVDQFMSAMVGAQRWAGLPERTRRARHAEGPAMLAELGDLRRNRPWHPAQIVVPVVACHGSEARPHHRRGTRHVADTVAGATLMELDGAGHGAPLSHPQAFAHRFVGAVCDLAGPPWPAGASGSVAATSGR